MAAVVTVYSSGKPIDLFYVIKEPKFDETINSYLSSNGCSASYVSVSKDPTKSKFKIAHMVSNLATELPNLQKPSRPIGLIDLLQEMMNRDYISTVCLTPEDRRKLKRKQSTTISPDTTTVPGPASPMFDSSFDDDALMEISRMEASRNEIDQSLLNFPVLDAIQKLSDKMDAQMNITRELVKDITGIKEEIQEIRRIQGQQAEVTNKIRASDLKERLCVYCATGNHSEDKCIWSLLRCSECQAIGHNPWLHKATDKDLKSRILATHGANFSFTI